MLPCEIISYILEFNGLQIQDINVHFLRHTARDNRASYNAQPWFIDPQNCHSEKRHNKDIFKYLVYVSV